MQSNLRREGKAQLFDSPTLSQYEHKPNFSRINPVDMFHSSN
jgi:hypothetical protein